MSHIVSTVPLGSFLQQSKVRVILSALKLLRSWALRLFTLYSSQMGPMPTRHSPAGVVALPSFTSSLPLYFPWPKMEKNHDTFSICSKFRLNTSSIIWWWFNISTYYYSSLYLRNENEVSWSGRIYILLTSNPKCLSHFGFHKFPEKSERTS